MVWILDEKLHVGIPFGIAGAIDHTCAVLLVTHAHFTIRINFSCNFQGICEIVDTLATILKWKKSEKKEVPFPLGHFRLEAETNTNLSIPAFGAWGTTKENKDFDFWEKQARKESNKIRENHHAKTTQKSPPP